MVTKIERGIALNPTNVNLNETVSNRSVISSAFYIPRSYIILDEVYI